MDGDEVGDAVRKDEIVKGYEYSKGKYVYSKGKNVISEPSELENLRVSSKHNISVSQFIDLSELNPRLH